MLKSWKSILNYILSSGLAKPPTNSVQKGQTFIEVYINASYFSKNFFIKVLIFET
jgi:hypothetical protein